DFSKAVKNNNNIVIEETKSHLFPKFFFQEFFTSPEVYPYLQSDPSHPIGQPLSKLTLTRIPCTLTDMRLLARLTHPSNGIVMKEYDLRQCLQKEVDGFLIADELRKVCVYFYLTVIMYPYLFTKHLWLGW
ncbi:hypothetical protein WDU94_002346, partial [Cyamophila willieti]